MPGYRQMRRVKSPARRKKTTQVTDVPVAALQEDILTLNTELTTVNTSLNDLDSRVDALEP